LTDVIEGDKVTKTVMFIFLAPLVGMVISMFITLVTIVRNLWTRIAFILVAAIATWFLFLHLQQGKLEENLAKYYKVDVLKKAAAEDHARSVDLEAARARYEAARSHLTDFGSRGGQGVAEAIQATVDPGVDVAKLGNGLDNSDNSIIRVGLMCTVLLFIAVYIYTEKVRTPTAQSVANMFKRLQLFSSAAFSIGHGGNDAQKVMGIITAALIAHGTITDIKEMPSWVPLACYTAIGLGTLSGGWKIVKTMGTRITKVTPLEGVCAETSGAMTLYLTEQMGIPVSTTHTITGSIIGVGATKRLSAVRWGVTIQLLWAWILTIPVSALLAGLAYWICTLFGL
jgi:phosphate/sulfate permease